MFFGEYGIPTLRYQIDAYQPVWRCGLEVEAGRAWMGNAIYRDLVQALVMVQVDHLVLAVSNIYKYQSGGKAASSTDYKNTCAVAEALYSPYACAIALRADGDRVLEALEADPPACDASAKDARRSGLVPRQLSTCSPAGEA